MKAAKRGSLLAFALAVAGPALAQEVNDAPDSGGIQQALGALHLTTTARVDYFQSSKTLGDNHDLLGATLQIKALPHINDRLDGKVEARATDADVRNRDGDAQQSRLLEAYLTVHSPKADLRLGNQIVAWGRADGINPTDNLTPHDYVVPLPLEEDQRFGVWAGKLDAYLTQNLTFTLLATPFFVPSKFALPPGSPVVETRPARTGSNTELALKLNKTGGDVDWSVSYYRGYRPLPSVAVTVPSLDLRYDRIDVIGADLAHNIGRVGFRTEVAYTRSTESQNVDPNTSSSRLFWVGGIDRTLLENLNVNLQWFWRWMPHYQAPDVSTDPGAHTVATLNSIISGQEARSSHGMTFRISNSWLNQTLTAELFAVINFTRGDHYLRPLLTYTFNDHFKGMLGGELYRGPKDTQYGLFKSTSGVFAELRYGL
jgi:hypothetical protein